MTNASHEIISPTAKYAAHLRAMTKIPYSQEIASVCNTEEVFRNIVGEHASEITWMVPLVEARFKSVNSLIDHYKVPKILELASGLSSRGLVMSEHPEVSFVESDLPELLQEKKRIVYKILMAKGVSARPNLHFKAVDVLDKKQIFSALEIFSEGPICVICEALLNYFTLQEKKRLAENIYAVLNKYGGVWITPDISTQKRSQEAVYSDTEAKKAFGLLSCFTGKNFLKNSFDDEHHAQSFFEEIGFAVEKRVQGEMDLRLDSLDLPDEHRKTTIQLLSVARIWTLKIK